MLQGVEIESKILNFNEIKTFNLEFKKKKNVARVTK